MSFLQPSEQEVVIKPAPEFSDISYAGDGKMFIMRGLNGYSGKINATSVPQAPYDNSLDFQEDDYFDSAIKHSYKKFNLDYFITSNVKLQSTDLKVKGAHIKDFVIFEVLYLADPANDIWVLGKRFVKRFYFNTDLQDQDTPTLPYSKTLNSGVFAIRMVYHKSLENNEDVYLRANYMLHESEVVE